MADFSEWGVQLICYMHLNPVRKMGSTNWHEAEGGEAGEFGRSRRPRGVDLRVGGASASELEFLPDLKQMSLMASHRRGFGKFSPGLESDR